MTTAVVSPFFDFEAFNKNNKLLGYNGNLAAPHANVPGALLDRKAVGTPGAYQRRHSVSGGAKFNQNQFLNSLKAAEHSPLLAGLGGNNKENHLRPRDRSFSETGERLLHKCLGPASPTGGQVNSSRYKTELCRPFEENGACKYGDKCQFAHGIHELRSLSRHPKYKTELCRTFHTIGFCPYGPRCHFIHNADERRGPPLKSDNASSRSPCSSSSSGETERPRLQHSYSFAGFPSSAGLRDSPTSVTPPPVFFPDEVPDWSRSNPFTYSSQEVANLFGPSLGGVPLGAETGDVTPPSPTGGPYYFRPMLESPRMFDSPSSPRDSLSDQEGYQSSSGSSLSGSESPTLDTTRRLPIFSRLSISDD
ncbi:mRNA decay activator protein ZFP36L1a [Syngnathoides biaculeatus]|uniref:mRNA decay activator protein ZFP36L1a n=1 Tax=Syngnathoides biaculeatus TaxID=300417 RepID=UPI002ADDDED0|nr:mRNA decay activator protein ZFP36L1a [Syngnathoides biaculeatus]